MKLTVEDYFDEVSNEKKIQNKIRPHGINILINSYTQI